MSQLWGLPSKYLPKLVLFSFWDLLRSDLPRLSRSGFYLLSSDAIELAWTIIRAGIILQAAALAADCFLPCIYTQPLWWNVGYGIHKTWLTAYRKILYSLDHNINGETAGKTSIQKKQKQHQRSRKEKPQQHNFTHPLLAAALKVSTVVLHCVPKACNSNMLSSI